MTLIRPLNKGQGHLLWYQSVSHIRRSLRQQRVRPSVCPSRAGIESKRRTSVMISSLSGSTTILVFWCQISSQNSTGVTPSRGRQTREGWVNQHFSVLSLNTSKTVADTIRYDTIAEFNVDSKAEYSALSSTRSQKKKLKQTTPVPL